MIQDEQNFYCRFIVTLETEELLQIGYLKEHGSVLLQWLKALKKKRIHGFNYPEKYFRLAISFFPPRWHSGSWTSEQGTDTVAKASSPLICCSFSLSSMDIILWNGSGFTLSSRFLPDTSSTIWLVALIRADICTEHSSELTPDGGVTSILFAIFWWSEAPKHLLLVYTFRERIAYSAQGNHATTRERPISEELKPVASFSTGFLFYRKSTILQISPYGQNDRGNANFYHYFYLYYF